MHTETISSSLGTQILSSRKTRIKTAAISSGVNAREDSQILSSRKTRIKTLLTACPCRLRQTTQILSSRKTRIKTIIYMCIGLTIMELRYYPPEKQGLRLPLEDLNTSSLAPSDTILQKNKD